MKNIFIGGVAKSGKSRLAVKLCENSKYNHIPLDYFASSFRRKLPEVGITSNIDIQEESSKKYALFLSRFIEIAESNENEFFILDSAHIFPKDIINYLDPNKWEVYYLGYSNITPEDKLKELRNNLSGGWVADKTDEEMLELLSKMVPLSQEIAKQCEECNILYLDTSEKDILEIFDFNREV